MVKVVLAVNFKLFNDMKTKLGTNKILESTVMPVSLTSRCGEIKT